MEVYDSAKEAAAYLAKKLADAVEFDLRLPEPLPERSPQGEALMRGVAPSPRQGQPHNRLPLVEFRPWPTPTAETDFLAGLHPSTLTRHSGTRNACVMTTVDSSSVR